MISGTMGKKLDLSKLTDEEAKHVWEVIQRDFDLRKKEEERLGELKTKLEKEDTKLELLGTQTSLTDSHCIRCLQPFKLLLNSKRPCLDCRLYTCKSCSRYNKKERGWVCDPCRTSRVLKMGTLDWYHEHVRSRFKRFGSAKVMRSLYKRLLSEQRLKSELAGSHDADTYSMPDVRDMYDMPEEDDVTIDASEAQRYRLIRKTKRLLSVHPLDFDLDSEYSAQSRRQSLQHSGGGEGVTRKESMIAEADIASVFQQILEEQGQVGGNPEQEFSTEVHLRINSRRKSLEKSSISDDSHFSEHRMIRAHPSPKGSPTGQLKGQQRSQCYADMDSSDEEGEGVPRFPLYQSHFPKRRSRASSQENLPHSKPQISELNRRMSAIERLLKRLEQKIVVPSEEGVQSDADLEEKKLKKKLGELAGNIRDKGLSSEEDVGRRKKVLREAVMSSSSDDLPNEAQKVYMAAGKTYSLETKLKDLEETAKSRYSGTTDSELSELEDKVASTAATVQNTESEVSDIENRIAALSAAGLTVVPERNRRKFSGQTVATQQSVRRKLSNSHQNQSEADKFDRNALYRGSLTQRTPAFKVKRNAAYAKPIMAQHP
ncbi:melanophilin-like isoform X1 [Acipenser oxyrinchus oxyrinchus]|uniref:Melanophilin-like isoform X1 n=1 Tax=Acipenser oxyrinchus oxyrinchus TaxID=40147 RepID=A0AAD8DDD8_ACIOX|nr:melanophilin-like isoform X1 [Acipenser oxyrinchus oxyrinchus]